MVTAKLVAAAQKELASSTLHNSWHKIIPIEVVEIVESISSDYPDNMLQSVKDMLSCDLQEEARNFLTSSKCDAG